MSPVKPFALVTLSTAESINYAAERAGNKRKGDQTESRLVLQLIADTPQ